MRTSLSVIEIWTRNFAHVFCLPRPYLFVGTSDSGPVKHIAAIYLKLNDRYQVPYMERLLICRNIFKKSGIHFYSLDRCKIRRNWSGRTTVAYSCHINWPLTIKINIFLYSIKNAPVIIIDSVPPKLTFFLVFTYFNLKLPQFLKVKQNTSY